MPIAVRVVKEKVFNDWAAALKAQGPQKAKEIIRNVAVELRGQTKRRRHAADAIVAGSHGRQVPACAAA